MFYDRFQVRAVVELLRNERLYDLIRVWNVYFPDEYIYNDVDEVAEKFKEKLKDEPTWLARAVFYGNVDYWRYPVQFESADLLMTVNKHNFDYAQLAKRLICHNNVQFHTRIWLKDGADFEINYCDDFDEAKNRLLDEYADYLVESGYALDDTVFEGATMKFVAEFN